MNARKLTARDRANDEAIVRALVAVRAARNAVDDLLDSDPERPAGMSHEAFRDWMFDLAGAHYNLCLADDSLTNSVPQRLHVRLMASEADVPTEHVAQLACAVASAR